MRTALASVLAGVMAMASAGARAGDESRPNFLIAFADDWGRHAGAYAAIDSAGTINDAIRTPHFDRIAREGVLFRDAFVSSPSCTPCRSAFLSGQHFWRTGRGAILRGAVWDAKIPSFPLLLRDAGYAIGQSYKVWSPGSPKDAPYGGRRFEYERRARDIADFSGLATRAVADGQPPEAVKARLCEEAARNLQDFLADRKPGQPFCYWFGPTNPHRPWVRGSGKALWGIDPDDLKGKMPPFLPDVPEVREDLADYFGESQAFDAMLGALVHHLEKIGELDNTVIIVSGDHGAPGFPYGKCNLYDFGTRVPLAIRWGRVKPGRVVDDLVSLTDLAPTILEFAGLSPPSVMTGRSLVSLLRSDRSGRIDPSRSAVYIGRERHVDTARDGFLPYPQRAIRTQDYLYILNFEPDRWPLGSPYELDGAPPPGAEALTTNTRVTLRDMDAGPTKAWLVAHRNDPEWGRFYDLSFGKRPREELYALADDPDQVRNIASDPRFAGVLAELNDRLMAELRRTGDPRVTGDGQYFETWPLAGEPPEDALEDHGNPASD